ncbi:MAG: AraC family transcriptional regulator [Spirochaetaceae bacterium]|jgi:AraC-like DNA-binding protein|nr:AraC family transcriptional regulator [Spirochaetaceae bacterium]
MTSDFRLIDPEAGFSIIRKTRAPTNQGRHFHPAWELFYLASGSRTFFYASRTISIAAGDLLCVRPGVLHRGLNRKNEVCDLFNIYFDDSASPFFLQLLPLLTGWEAGGNPVMNVRGVDRFRIVKQFTDIAEELREKRQGYIPMAWGLLSQTLVELARYIPPGGNGNSEYAMNRTITDVVDYLCENYRNPISLGGTARLFSLTESYLSRAFHQATQFSFIEYLNSLRIREACRLLIEGNMQVSAIAEECGFVSITQFGRCFRKFTGTSPLVYRKNGGFR